MTRPYRVGGGAIPERWGKALAPEEGAAEAVYYGVVTRKGSRNAPRDADFGTDFWRALTEQGPAGVDTARRAATIGIAGEDVILEELSAYLDGTTGNVTVDATVRAQPDSNELLTVTLGG